MAALFRRKKHLDVSGAPQKKGRSQSLDPTSLAYLSLKQAGGSSDKKGQTIDRLTVPEVTETPPTNSSPSSSPSHGHSPNRRASDLFEGGLRQFQQLYKRRGSREPPETEESSSKTLQVPKPRQRSGSVDVGRLTVSSGRRGSTEGSRSLPQQGRRGSVDPGLRLYTALRPNVNGVRRGSVDANVKQFQAVYQQRKALKSEQAALYAAGSGSTSPVPVSIPESPEITSRYHKPKPGSAAAAAAEAAAAELDAAQREMKSHSTISSASFNANLYRRHDDPYRRRSLSGGDAISDSNRMAILFRDSRGLPAVDPFMDTLHSTDLSK
ncbi:hypothetical protein FJT64_016302 [Amphibalanus amphitrite]|uniref:Uncharacterized protein n=1 Tax=Amphibalanus amphitrite TaxID=1232801 RepID=A0A6A4X1J0_AMPAM|nr:hypothetical protein FJT64_016302 [Amphibalanus amphitrite]